MEVCNGRKMKGEPWKRRVNTGEKITVLSHPPATVMCMRLLTQYFAIMAAVKQCGTS